jgi:hypothetical protein
MQAKCFLETLLGVISQNAELDNDKSVPGFCSIIQRKRRPRKTMKKMG